MINNVSIIAIGNELLNGKILNTNSHTIARSLNRAGFGVEHSLTVADTRDALFKALDFCSTSDAIIVTGGLGPTPDDQTRNFMAEYLSCELTHYPSAEEHLKRYFTGERAQLLTKHQKIQTMFPSGSTLLNNPQGTAMGFLVKDGTRPIFCTPGVPHEMERMFHNEILPFLQEATPAELYSREILTMNIGEANQSILLDDLVIPEWVTFSSLPETDGLRVSLTARIYNNNQKREIDSIMDNIIVRFKKAGFAEEIISHGGVPLIQTLQELCIEKSVTVSTVESCTGGRIGHLLTSLPGSSRYYHGGYITYDNNFKERFVAVAPQVLQDYGAVSKEVVYEMAKNGRTNCKTDFCIAVSGIAGPDGGTPDKPVGTVWMAIAHPHGVETFMKNFRGDRNCLRDRVSFYLINELRKKIINYTK